jgi:6-phosphogluconolactonase
MARVPHRCEVGLTVLGLLLAGTAGQARAQKAKDLGVPWWIYVGTFSGPQSKGIYLHEMKTSENPDIPEYVTMTALGLAAETPSPSFLVVDAARPALFAVNETDSFEGKKSGSVSAFAVDAASGKLTALNRRPSLGARPCHLALDRERRHLLVANCQGGSVAVLPVAPDGRLGEATDLRQHTGKSVHPQRQQAPHPEGVAFSPDNRFAFVCDLGLDRVMTYRFDARAGKLAPHEPAFAELKPGAGPRRLVFRPDGKFAYTVNELDSTVTAFAYDARAGVLKPLQTLSTLPGYYDGPNRATEIGMHPSGKYLFASNGGHNSIVLYGIDAAAGTLTYVEDQSTYGTMPLQFGMDTPGRHFAVANRDSGGILILRAPESGRIKPGGEVVKQPAAACAVFLSPAAGRQAQRQGL